MKKLWFILATAFLISISLWINPVGAMAAPVTVYQDCDFGGYHVDLSEGNYGFGDLPSLGIRNDDLSSIKVEPGYEATLYAHDFRGEQWKFTSDDSCFTSRGLDNVVSSIQVVKLSPPLPSCAQDYVLNPATNHCYGLTEALTWPNAEAAAVEAGGHLVTLNDEAEQTWVLDTFGDQVKGGSLSSFWIGFNILEHDDKLCLFLPIMSRVPMAIGSGPRITKSLHPVTLGQVENRLLIPIGIHCGVNPIIVQIAVSSTSPPP